MNFHLEFTPKSFVHKIQLHHKLLLIGSCFTENIGAKLKQHKFEILENPNGILFNPTSITQSLKNYIQNKKFSEAELFFENECWHSWQHHSRFSNINKTCCLQNINHQQQLAHDFLKTAVWVMITLGSAFAYQLSDETVVANCHKLPTNKFVKKLIPSSQIIADFTTVIQLLKLYNPTLKIIFTISPVRHLREGFVENNRSKALLIEAVHQLVEDFDYVYYFPAYELVIDDLRDYRFYAEDMVHPNYAATNYVWNKFIEASTSIETQKNMKEIAEIIAAKNHKAFNPTSVAHQQFLEKNYQKTLQLKAQFPYMNFTEELEYFSTKLT